MSRSLMRTRATFTLIALATVGALVACANDSDSSSAPQDSNVDSGNTLLDGSTNTGETSDDASPDGGSDASRERDAAPRTCSDDNFCHSELPEKSDLRGVWGDGQGVVWTISYGGSVLRWDGSAWSTQATDLGPLTKIWGSGPTDLWLVNDSGEAFHGTGASPTAITFEPVTLSGGDETIPMKSVWGTGPNDVWIVGGVQDLFGDYPWPGKARVFHMTDPSTGFVLDDTLSAEPTAFMDIWGTPESGTWIQGAQGANQNGFLTSVVMRRAPGSSTWETLAMPPDPASINYAPDPMSFSASGAMGGSSAWLAGTGGSWNRALYHGKSTDNGQTYTWSFVAQNNWDLPLKAFWGASETDLWGVGESGRLAHWNGSKWQQAAIRVTDAPVGKTLYGIWGTSSTDFWVVGDNIAIHKTTGNKP